MTLPDMETSGLLGQLSVGVAPGTPENYLGVTVHKVNLLSIISPKLFNTSEC